MIQVIESTDNNNADLVVAFYNEDTIPDASVKDVVDSVGVDTELGASQIFHPQINGKYTKCLIVGTGSGAVTIANISKLIAPIIAASKDADVVNIQMQNLADTINSSDVDFVENFTSILTSLQYEYTETIPEKEQKSIIFNLVKTDAVSDPAHWARSVDNGTAIGRGMNTMKYLGDLPSNICNPSFLADYAEGLPNIEATVYGEMALDQMGAGALLSVSQGSDTEGKMIVMEYNNAPEGTKPIMLVGKAVTFDSGGISLKPGAKMDEMKYDMCGGASVFGAMQAIVEMELPVYVVGLVGAVENMPSGKATKPGDVVTSMSGKTIAIGNTDAEGRMVLADMLTYAGKHYEPSAVIDIATLTGACCVALGDHATGVFSNSDSLTQEILEAGTNVHDRGWPLPIWDEYNKQMDSDFADMTNSGKPGGGASTAACFLNRFASDFDYEWAHLDIAGTAWSATATGRPVPMLVEFIKNRAI